MLETEMLYHVREDDSVIGPVERNRAHTEGLLHRSGVIFLLRSDGGASSASKPSKANLPGPVRFFVFFSRQLRGELQGGRSPRIEGRNRHLGRCKIPRKFSHQDLPENQIVAVFMCESDASVTIDQEEAMDATFYSKSEVNRIVAREKVTPWLRDGWKLASGAVRLLPQRS